MKNLTFHRILVPIDFGEASIGMLKLAEAICQRHNAQMRLLHVLNPDQYNFMPTESLWVSVPREEVVQAETERLEDWANGHLGQTVIAYSVECRTGNIPNEIVEAAVEYDADLILTGTHSTTGLLRYMMGSVAYRVLKHAPCPVLTVPTEQHSTDFKNILFPLRPNVEALEKYEYVRSIAQKNNAHLTVMGILDADAPALRKPLNLAMDQLNKYLVDDAIEADLMLTETDSAANAVLNQAEELHADLIVVTADQSTSLQHLLAGPFEKQIINRSPVPVLSVSPAYIEADPIQPAEVKLSPILPSFGPMIPPVQFS